MTKPPRMGTWRADCRALDKRRSADGLRRLCRQCSAELMEARRRYCSDACRETHYIRYFWNIARAKVIERDKYICKACGRDAAALRKQFWKLRMLRGHADPKVVEQAECDRRALVEELNAEGFHLDKWVSYPEWGELFQVDHIVPVACGGGSCTLENLQILCTGCHKKKTAEQEGARRKPQLPLPMEIEVYG